MADRDLLIVVPSRGRPENIARLWAAMQKTCRANTHMIVGLDKDDPALNAYLARWPHGGYGLDIQEGLHQVGAWLNELAVRRVNGPGYCAVGHFGDDNLPLTEGWDVEVLRALETHPFAFANDLYPREPGSLPCHIFMRSYVIGALGYMAPPGYRHMVDLAWLEWGRACGIAYLDDVTIEHLHWSVGKAPMDETYTQVNGCLVADNDYHRQYCADGLQQDIRKIKAAIGAHEHL
jgi:hypothetical protein